MKSIQIEGSIDVPDDTYFDDFTDYFDSVMSACGWQFFGILQPLKEDGNHV
jgi:hypothetical protein